MSTHVGERGKGGEGGKGCFAQDVITKLNARVSEHVLTSSAAEARPRLPQTLTLLAWTSRPLVMIGAEDHDGTW